MTDNTPTELTASRLPRRVLFLTHALDLSGVAVHIRTLVQSLAGQGIEFHVAARQLDPGKPFGFEYFQSAGITAHQIDFPGYGFNLSNTRKSIRARRALYELIHQVGIDLVHVHAPSLVMVAYRPCRRLGVPYLTTFNIAVTGRWKIRLSRLAHRLMKSPFGMAALAISQDMAGQLVQRLKVPPHRVRVVPYVVDESRFSPPEPAQRAAARASLGLNADDLAVAVVAAYERRKNHQLIFDALAQIGQSSPRVVALCAGTDFSNYRPTLERLAADRRLGDRARFLGFTDSREVFRAADAAALTSFSEGFPLAIVEAMHCALPIIRTPSEGAREQVSDGVNGYVVPFDDPARLAEVLRDLARDPALRQRLGHASRQIATEKFTLTRMGARMREIYAEAIAGDRIRGITRQSP